MVISQAFKAALVFGRLCINSSNWKRMQCIPPFSMQALKESGTAYVKECSSMTNRNIMIHQVITLHVALCVSGIILRCHILSKCCMLFSDELRTYIDNLLH